MDKIWLKSYPPGVPSEVNASEYRSIAQLFDHCVAKFAARPAFVNGDTSISYADLERLSREFGAYLQQSLKLQRGARVALMIPNVLQYPIAMFGILRSGYVVVNCNPQYTPRELAFQLTDSGAEAIVVAEHCAAVVAEVIGATKVKHVITTPLGEMLGVPGAIVDKPGAVSFRSALRQGAGQPFTPPELGPDSLAFLQYTGGTTGQPKAAMLSHGNIVVNLEQYGAWLRPSVEDGNETIITALPLYHIFSLTVNCLCFLKFGATNILITDPRDIPGFVKQLERHPFTVITGVNTLYNGLLHNAEFTKLDFSRARLCIAGGMAVQKAVAERWKQVTGKPLLEGYGLTEASPAVTMNPTNRSEFNASIGLPLPSTEISIRDDDDREMPVGAAGELCIRGPQIMKGYWNAPGETARTMTPDGFLRTGDIATVDETGFVRIVDRKKDMVVVSGFKVYPNEIEDVVALYDGVLEVGAFGVPDPASGEALKIAVVRKRPDLGAEELLAHCRKYLTGYKIPRYVEFRKQLPKTTVGKIIRRALREEQLQAQAQSCADAKTPASV